jgi:geranylgeranyl diphosphate synthase, type II
VENDSDQYLLLAAYNLFYDDVEKAIAPALAIEVFHNFTLLHDDIMDKADLRRNRPTVHKKWNENVAILSGDAMLIKAYSLILQSPNQSLSEIFDLFNQTAMQVCEGQQLDMNYEDLLDVSESEYIEMIRLKTSVLVAASLKMGALCARASEKDANLLYDFGLKLGLAFQLQDDYLDAFGNPEKFGKKTGGDIVANKKTYLLIKSLELAQGELKNKLNNLLGNSDINEKDKIQKVIEIFNELNIKELVKKKMDQYYNQAIDSLNLVEVDQAKKAFLIEFADRLMIRES